MSPVDVDVSRHMSIFFFFPFYRTSGIGDGIENKYGFALTRLS